jgi:hypothetical protein
MDNERKASFFVGLPQGKVRDRWLERHAGVQVIIVQDDEDIDNYNREED